MAAAITNPTAQKAKTKADHTNLPLIDRRGGPLNMSSMMLMYTIFRPIEVRFHTKFSRLLPTDITIQPTSDDSGHQRQDISYGLPRMVAHSLECDWQSELALERIYVYSIWWELIIYGLYSGLGY